MLANIIPDAIFDNLRVTTDFKSDNLREKIHWIWIQLEGFWSWATNALLIFLLGWLPLFLGF